MDDREREPAIRSLELGSHRALPSALGVVALSAFIGAGYWLAMGRPPVVAICR